MMSNSRYRLCLRFGAACFLIAASLAFLGGVLTARRVHANPVPAAPVPPATPAPVPPVPPQSPVADPVPAAPAVPDPVREAVDAEKVLRTREAELVAALKKLDTTLADFKPGDLKMEKQSLEDMRRVIHHLRTYSVTLSAGHGQATKHLRLYRGSLEAAPAKLSASGNRHRIQDHFGIEFRTTCRGER